ncbi:MAG: FAD-dependent oxidoreductase [Spirochaetales bacterium]|nr:FAD-dependent oxidoreductase [Spirochaetales bacterium]
MSIYKHLMSPLKVRKFVLKNRMISATSIPHFLQGPESYPADGVIYHCLDKARGSAVVTCMGINNLTSDKNFPRDMDIGHFPDYNMYDTACQNYFLQLTDAIHFYDSLACMNLFVGPPSSYLLIKKDPNAVQQLKPHEASDDEHPFVIPHGEELEFEYIDAHKLPHEYDEETLDKICESYAEQADYLSFLGFDMVSIHYSYRANLPAKFFSPITNHRTDDWGGSLENRMRFPLMVLQRVRERVKDNMIIEISWSAEEEEGGYNLEESAAFLRAASEYVDIVQLRAHEGDASHPTGFNLKELPFLHYSEYMKKNVPNLIISTIGGYQDPELNEKVLADGQADVIAMARSWISNTNYGQLVQEGRRDDIVPCIRCNKCHGRDERAPMVSVCSVNPIIGLQHRIDKMVDKPSSPKSVAIVGGGPAGMRCAMDLYDRGHSVTIYEASDALGGAIRTADDVDFKWPLKRFKEYCIAQVQKRDIKIHLNTRVNPDDLKDKGYDVVIAALGAVSILPPIPGIDNPKVQLATDVFMNKSVDGKNVVVIGGGEVGVECGMYLAKQGHDVTVLEMRDRIAADSTPIHFLSMFKEAWEALPNFSSIVKATVTEVTNDGVKYKNDAGDEQFISADAIIVSAGMRPMKDEALSFYDAAENFYMIGDCKNPATLVEAMRTAFSTASRI